MTRPFVPDGDAPAPDLAGNGETAPTVEGGARHAAPAPKVRGPVEVAAAARAGWAAGRRYWADGVVARTPFLVGLVTFAGLWMTRRLYRPGLAQGDDFPYHIARDSFALHDLFLHGHIDGWSPLFNGGSQQFLLYGPGLAFISGAFRLLTLGQVSDGTLVSYIAALSYVATAPALYLLARALRLSPVGAAVAGLLALIVSVPFGVGPSGTFGNGLLPHQVAVPFFLIVLTGIVRLLEGPSRRWTLVTASSAALVMVTHSLSLPVLAPAAAIMVGLGWVRIQPTVASLRRLVVTGLYTAGFSAFWWVPLLENPGPRPPLATWGSPPFATRVHDMATGQDWTHPAVAALTVAACIIVLVRLVATARTSRWLGDWAWSIALTGPILLGVVQIMHNRMSGDLGVSIGTRGLGYSGLLCMLPVGAVADLVLNSPTRTTADRRILLRPRHAALLVLALIPAVKGYVPAANRIAKAKPPAPALVAAAQTLRDTMAPRDVFAWVNEGGFDQSFGPVHPDMWLVMQTGHSSLNGLGGNSVTPIDTYLPYHLTEKQPGEVTRAMDRAGVRVMLMQTSTVPKVVAPNDWRTLSSRDNLTIVERTAPNRLSLAVDGGNSTLSVTRWSNEAIDWKVDGGSGSTVLALPAFPKWSVRVDGRAFPQLQEEGYIFLDLPPGSKTVTARYHRSTGDRVGVLISLVSVLAVGWLLAGEDRRRRVIRRFDRRPEPTPGEPDPRPIPEPQRPT